jgi:hypothetical protein
VWWCGQFQDNGNKKDVSLLVVATHRLTSLPMSSKCHGTYRLSIMREGG